MVHYVMYVVHYYYLNLTLRGFYSTISTVMIIRIFALILVLLSSSACSQATLLSSIGVGMGVAQKSTASVVYSTIDVGVSATTDKSIREHILDDKGEEVAPLIPADANIQWVTPK